MTKTRWILNVATVSIVLALVAASCGTSDDAQSTATSTGSSITATVSDAEPTSASTTVQTTTTSTTTTAAVTTTVPPPPITWSLDDELAVGRIVADGSTAATVLRTETGLDIVGIDVSSGDLLWRGPYSMGGRFPGSGLGGFDISDGVVAHMAGDLGDQRSTIITGRDARSGEVLWEIDAPLAFGAEGCGEVFCISSTDTRRGVRTVLGVDARSGEIRWQMDGGDIDYITDPDLVIVLEVGDRPVVHAVEPDSGDVKWTVSPEEALGENMSTNYGWNFVRRDGVILGTLNRPFQDDSIYGATYGLDEATGEALWWHEDIRMPRWRIDSAMAARASDGDDWFRHDTLNLLDARTGELVEAVTLPEDDLLSNKVVFASEIGYGSDGRSVFWYVDGEWVGLNVDTGDSTTAPAVLWTSVLEPEDLSIFMPGSERTAWLRGVRYQPIASATDERVDMAPEDVPNFVGPTIGGWTIWTDVDGILRGRGPSQL